jgi:hypothetical protein
MLFLGCSDDSEPFSFPAITLTLTIPRFRSSEQQAEGWPASRFLFGGERVDRDAYSVLTAPCKRAEDLLVKRHWDLPGKTISVAMSGNYDTNLLRFTDGTWAILQGEDIRDFMMNGEAVNAMFLDIISEDEYAAEMNAQADAMTGVRP